MLMYDYLITYKFSCPGYLTASDGSIQLSRKHKIDSFDEVNKVIEFISNRLPEGSTNVAIYNIMFLGRNHH